MHTVPCDHDGPAIVILLSGVRFDDTGLELDRIKAAADAVRVAFRLACPVRERQSQSAWVALCLVYSQLAVIGHADGIPAPMWNNALNLPDKL